MTTKVSKKEGLGKKKDKTIRCQQKQGLNKQKKMNYFPIQNLEKIFPNKSSLVTCPVISPKASKA